MISAFMAALLATSPSPPTARAPAPFDVGCFRLMAALADSEDPAVRDVGMIGAQYFLGRIDAAAPGLDPGALGELPAGPGRAALLRRCADELGRAGHDFRAIGDRLEPARPTA
jgi:hypothetical protein